MIALQLSAFAAVATTCVVLASASSNAVNRVALHDALCHPGSSRRCAFVTATRAPKQQHQWRRTEQRFTTRRTNPVAAKQGGVEGPSEVETNSNNNENNENNKKKKKNKNKYADQSKKVSQEELLLELESKIDDYGGRMSSKLTRPPTASHDDETAPAPVPPHRCALITILGRPNMGKSTLLNALLADELAITNARPQTTRHAILGVLTTERSQLCLTDTPGIIGKPAYRLQEGMMDAVKGAVRDADAFLVVTDAGGGDDDDDGDGEEEGEDLGLTEEMLKKLRGSGRPVIVCVNKVDLVAEEGDTRANAPARAVQAIHKWRSVLPDAFAILPTCAADGPDDPGVAALRAVLLANDPGADVPRAFRALGRPVPGTFATGFDVASVGDAARELLPAGPPLYHPDFLTDRTDRFCASELIREALFRRLGKELPYCCEVRVGSFDESSVLAPPVEDGEGSAKGKKPMIRMEATILVERDSQKGIVVGKGGRMIREVGTDARGKLQAFFGVKVFLDLRVKVDKNWRNDVDKLKKFGYMN